MDKPNEWWIEVNEDGSSLVRLPHGTVCGQRYLARLIPSEDYDALAAEVETWKCRAEINGKRAFECQEEIDKLRAENKLLVYQVTCATKNYDQLRAGNEKLKTFTSYLENQVVELNKQNDGFKGQLFQIASRPFDMDHEITELRAENEKQALEIHELIVQKDELFDTALKLRAENEKLKRIIAKELTENDELGCEFVYVSELKRANAELIKALNKIKSGSGRAEVLGLDMYRCPQCAAADIAAEALAKPGVTES